MSQVTPFILIREYKFSDESQIRPLISHAYLSNVSVIWINAFTKEITFQMIVLTAAIMFIFVGIPLQYCVAAIPLVILFLYIAIYSASSLKATELFSGLKKPVQCWIAEVFEPPFALNDPTTLKFPIYMDKDIIFDKQIDLSLYHRKIIGTVAANNHRNLENAMWVYRMGVHQNYRRKGVGRSMLYAVKSWCKARNISSIELSVSECQDAARQLFVSHKFQLRQMYHKQVIGSVVTVLMYHLGFDCISSENKTI